MWERLELMWRSGPCRQLLAWQCMASKSTQVHKSCFVWLLPLSTLETNSAEGKWEFGFLSWVLVFLGRLCRGCCSAFVLNPPSLALGVEPTPFSRTWGNPRTSSLSSLSYLSIYALDRSTQTWLSSKTVSLEDRDCPSSFLFIPRS